MLTPDELREFRARAVQARCTLSPVKWVRLRDGPLEGLRVTVPVSGAAVVAWCHNTPRGCICAHYQPGAAYGEWIFKEWHECGRKESGLARSAAPRE